MIVLKILLLFLFSNNLIHVEAQLNKCKTPEGNEGYCINIWECSLKIKYMFSEKQNSLQTYNILKSVCDYTNSTIKLCCPLSSNTKQNPMLQEDTENFTDQENNADCNDDNSTEEILTEQLNSSDILELEETEIKTESITLKDDQYDGVLNNISPIDGQINETNVTEMVKNESEEVATTESSIDENSTAININLIRSNSELSLFKQEDNEVTQPTVRNKNINFVQESENNSDLDLLDPIAAIKKNISGDLKTMMNSENKINNNTIIIINMRDKSTIFNNNKNAEESVNQEDNDTTKTLKINMDLFKKIFHLIFSKNSDLGIFPLTDSTKSTEDDPNSSNISTEDDPNSSNISTEDLPVVSNISLENINSSENNTYQISIENIISSEANNYQKPNENISSSENNSFQNSTENISLESKDSLENDTDISSFLSDENDKEEFQYVSFPNPPHCGRTKKSLIIKGEYAWEVLLKEKNKKSTKIFCKGTLITRQHIVTTANCIKNREIESVLIFSKNLSAYITLKIKDIKVHEHFVPKYIQNDIALITLQGPIKLVEISPICLMADSYLTNNLTGIYAISPGYWKEKHKNAGKPSPKIEKVICESECANELNDSEEYVNIDESILCTEPKTNSEDICLGNEGSPLMIAGKFKDSKKYYYQIGMVSGVNFCGENHSPSIFVNINLYLNWILKNM